MAEDENQEGQEKGFDFDAWLEMAESGELDIYSCLGLSDANNLDPDTRKLLAKIVGVLMLQLCVPVVMLWLQLTQGFHIRPLVPEIGFRTIGFALYLYSLYSMYNNALDECRSRLLRFALDNSLSSGYWWPLALGEFSNTMVSLVLVFTLYFIYTNSRSSVDLILNAVAVNFLGGVDAEMVNNEMRKDGVRNFQELTEQYRDDKAILTTNTRIGNITDRVLYILLSSVVVSGTLLAVLFFSLASPPEDED
jgi:ABC-type multidrug transport system fused ATPase/permease subunit